MSKFKKGQSGNPKGRPVGTTDRRTRYRELLDPHAPELVELAVNMAKDGNEKMLALILDRLLPARPRSNPIKIDTDSTTASDSGRKIIHSMLLGEIDPDQAKTAMSSLTSLMNVVEAEELSKRLDALEEKVNQTNS
jgi:hypothetical protein